MPNCRRRGGERLNGESMLLPQLAAAPTATPATAGLPQFVQLLAEEVEGRPRGGLQLLVTLQLLMAACSRSMAGTPLTSLITCLQAPQGVMKSSMSLPKREPCQAQSHSTPKPKGSKHLETQRDSPKPKGIVPKSKAEPNGKRKGSPKTQ